MPKETKDALDAPITPGLDGVTDVKKSDTPAPEPTKDDLKGAALAEAQALLNSLNETSVDRDHWKREYGQRSNEVGDLRREIKELKDTLTRKPTSSYDSDFVESGNDQVDIKTAIREVWGEITTTQERAQHEARTYWDTEWARVRSKPGYDQIADDFETASKDPKFQQDAVAGRDTLDSLYDRTMLKRLTTHLSQVLNNDEKGSSKNEPNSSTRVVEGEGEIEENKRKIQKAKEKKDLRGGIAEILKGM